jgi:hypothetical protein
MHLDARTPNFKLELFRVPQLSLVPAYLVSSRRPRQAVAYLVPTLHHCWPPSQVALRTFFLRPEARNCMISYL